MSSSDQDSRCSASPYLETFNSPHSSPSQQVPHLASSFTELTCAEFSNFHGSGKPKLLIVEQPQNHFRFRYKSEMVGTHGCLLGKTSANNKAKTHPMVELVNYRKRAVIRCRLAQHTKTDEHPHQLLEDEHEDQEVSAIVPEDGGYRIAFQGMGIIHTAKKDVASLLFKKYREKNKEVTDKDLLNFCETEAKSINLNIVRLKFTAHDIETDHEICEPVFSEPIHNMKSAATNDLKICRISRLYGRPKGGDDVYILVEKVNKKNINIRFVERDESGEERWSANAHFLQTDVHHQYAIVFRTPAYHNQQIESDVKVYVELHRPSDGRCSDPKEFTYKADLLSKQNKKRKAGSAFSSFDSSFGNGSIKSLSDIPTPLHQFDNDKLRVENEIMGDIIMQNAMTNIPNAGNMDLGDALLGEACDQNPLQLHYTVSPMLSQHDLQPITLDSAEFNELLRDMPGSERDDFREYAKYSLSIDMNFLRTSLETDSGRGKVPKVENSRKQSEKSHSSASSDKSSSEYSAVYTSENGAEVRKLLKEICDLLRNKTSFKKAVVKEKLERMFSMRLSNGDTFLFMALLNNRTSFEYIVKLIHRMKMSHLLNLTNDAGQTILHWVIVNDMPELISLLISNGCDPSIGDHEGNTAVHYAVTFQTCMELLLNAIRSRATQCDLNAVNKEKQTALHVAAVPGSDPSAIASSVQSIKLLLKHGASYNARDLEGRTPLHLATYDDCLPVARALLEFVPSSDIDATDSTGYTALQVVCAGNIRKNSVEIVKLLLEKKADPTVHDAHTLPAWRLARDKPLLSALLPVQDGDVDDVDVKDEPEDEFESADEGEEPCLSDLSQYVHELSRVLDENGAWRALASRLQHDALLNWYQNTASPTRALLDQLKEWQDGSITSKSLMLMLEDLGQTEAAQIIRSRINVNVMET